MDDDATRSELGGLTPEPAGTTEEPGAAQVEVTPPTPEQIAEAENLLRQAHLAKVRGQTSVARKLMEEAAQVAPGSAPVLEALGDEEMSHRAYSKAVKCYEAAMEADPGNVAIERKHGDAVFLVAQASAMFDLSASTYADSMASPKVAVILSLCIPGLGQMVTGRLTTGIVMLAGVVLGWLVAFLIPQGMAGFAGLFGTRSSVSEFNGVVLLPLAVAIVFHFWSVIDAAGRVDKGRHQKIDRPKPPVDKPFEL